MNKTQQIHDWIRKIALPAIQKEPQPLQAMIVAVQKFATSRNISKSTALLQSVLFIVNSNQRRTYKTDETFDLFMNIDGILYVYDSTRAQELEIEVYRKGNVGSRDVRLPRKRKQRDINFNVLRTKIMDDMCENARLQSARDIRRHYKIHTKKGVYYCDIYVTEENGETSYILILTDRSELRYYTEVIDVIKNTSPIANIIIMIPSSDKHILQILNNLQLDVKIWQYQIINIKYTEMDNIVIMPDVINNEASNI